MAKTIAEVLSDLRWRVGSFLSIDCDTDELEVLLAWVDRATESLRKVAAHAETFDAWPAPPADDLGVWITPGLDQDTCAVLRAQDVRASRDLLAELEDRRS